MVGILAANTAASDWSSVWIEAPSCTRASIDRSDDDSELWLAPLGCPVSAGADDAREPDVARPGAAGEVDPVSMGRALCDPVKVELAFAFGGALGAHPVSH